jgi:hypothetical protein
MRRLKGLLGRLAIWGAGLLVISMGLQGIVLRVAGIPAMAVVTAIDYDEEDGFIFVGCGVYWLILMNRPPRGQHASGEEG